MPVFDPFLMTYGDLGYVDTYIVLPSTIYGRATGILVDNGIQKTFSDQVPTIVRAGLTRGQGGKIGSGSNLWPNVEIHEGPYTLHSRTPIFPDVFLQSLNSTTPSLT